MESQLARARAPRSRSVRTARTCTCMYMYVYMLLLVLVLQPLHTSRLSFLHKMTESDDSWEQFSFDEEELYPDQNDSSSSSDSSDDSSLGEHGAGDVENANDVRGVEPYRFEPILAADEDAQEVDDDGMASFRRR